MRKLLIFALITASALGQTGVRFDSNATTSASNVPVGAQAPVMTLPNALVTVCEFRPDNSPCIDAVPVYVDQALTQQIPQPLQADLIGRFGFWILPGVYSYSIQDSSGNPVGTFPLSLTSPQGPQGPAGAGCGAGIGQCIISAPTVTQTITQPANTNLNIITSGVGLVSASNLTATNLNSTFINNVINPVPFPGADIGAKITAAIASAGCTNGCTISIPPGSYQMSSLLEIFKDNVRIIGNGATLVGSTPLNFMIKIDGNYDEVSGLTFSLNGSNFGVIATQGINQSFINNRFGGPAGSYIALSGSPSGAIVSENSFDGTTGCAFANNISVFDSAHVELSNNRAVNTCGFSYETAASNQILVHGNSVRQDTQQQSITATAGQTSFVFHWPSNVPTIQRVWIQVNGVPTTFTSVTMTSALVTTVVMPAQTAGAVVTALGWTGLENIQVNSQSFNIIVDGNVITGSGDAGIDVVSDFHMTTAGTAIATANQKVFTITASPGITVQGLPLINGRIATPDVATLSIAGNVYTITLVSPVPAGTVVTLVDFVNNQPASSPPDYPGSVTIQNNVVKEAASSCIAPEVSAINVVIQGNVVQDCGMGVQTGAFSSGIFTANAIGLSVKNNMISNTRAVPTMNAAISVQCSSCETGSMEKTQYFSGNTYQGTFVSGKLFVPALSTGRQSGIDVDGITIPYPDQINFDQPWGIHPPDTHYLSYSCTGAGMTRNTTSVIGGIASATMPSGNICNITPTNQIFFFNSLMRVTFWAQVVSGTPFVELFSNFTDPPRGTTGSVNVAVVGNQWKQYSIYMPTTGFDQPPGIFLRLDGSSGSMNIQNIVISATPFSDGPTTSTGSTSGVSQNFFSDTLTTGALQGSGHALACVDANGNFFRGTTTTCP